MRYYIDASVFLNLFLEGRRADEAEEILEKVEYGEATGYVSVLVVEEVAFKLLIAKASELGVENFWNFKKKFLKDLKFRKECYKPVIKFKEYLNLMSGLAWTNATNQDYQNALRIVEKYGLLTADAVHAALALKLKIPIATFDEEFKRIPKLRTIP